MRRVLQFRSIVLLAGALLLHACSDDPSEPGLSRSLSLALRHQTGFRLAAPDSISIDTVKLLLRRVKFHSSSSDDSGDVFTPPAVVHLATDGSLSSYYANRLPDGTYDRVRFSVHRLESGDVVPDPEFIDGTSGGERYSVIIKGRLRDSVFVYKSRIDADYELTITPPLAVTDGVKDANVTIIVDPYDWFRLEGTIIRPDNPVYAATIDENIRNSFLRAIRDDNRDGGED